MFSEVGNKGTVEKSWASICNNTNTMPLSKVEELVQAKMADEVLRGLLSSRVWVR